MRNNMSCKVYKYVQLPKRIPVNGRQLVINVFKRSKSLPYFSVASQLAAA